MTQKTDFHRLEPRWSNHTASTLAFENKSAPWAWFTPGRQAETWKIVGHDTAVPKSDEV